MIRRAATSVVRAVVTVAPLVAPAASGAAPGVVSHTAAGSASKAKRVKQYWTPEGDAKGQAPAAGGFALPVPVGV
jgi:hypothetical protein